MKKFLALFIVLGLCLSVLVGCLDPLFFGPNSDEPQETALEKAHTFLHEMYWYDAKTTPADYTLVTQIIVDDKTFTITWTVEIDSAFAGQVALVPAEDGKITVDVNEMAESDIAYKLIGSITDGKETLTVSFERIVPKYREFGFVDYVAAEKDAAVVVSGVVSGIISKSAGATRNCLYVNDSVGGYYIYDLTDDPVTAGIKVGQTVKITGKKDIYNGTYEIVKATVEIVDETIQALVPEDYTNIFASAAALTDEALVANQAHLVVRAAEIFVA